MPDLHEYAVRYLIDQLTAAPEPEDRVDDAEVLETLRLELASGVAEYPLRLSTTEEGFLAMPPAQIAESLVHDLVSACQHIRRERRVLAEAVKAYELPTKEAL